MNTTMLPCIGLATNTDIAKDENVEYFQTFTVKDGSIESMVRGVKGQFS